MRAHGGGTAAASRRRRPPAARSRMRRADSGDALGAHEHARARFRSAALRRVRRCHATTALLGALPAMRGGTADLARSGLATCGADRELHGAPGERTRRQPFPRIRPRITTGPAFGVGCPG